MALILENGEPENSMTLIEPLEFGVFLAILFFDRHRLIDEN